MEYLIRDRIEFFFHFCPLTQYLAWSFLFYNFRSNHFSTKVRPRQNQFAFVLAFSLHVVLEEDQFDNFVLLYNSKRGLIWSTAFSSELEKRPSNAGEKATLRRGRSFSLMRKKYVIIIKM